MQTNKRAVIYCRVSTKEQVDEGGSLLTQEKLCKDYALKNGYEIGSIFIEQGESAKTANRTELKKLLEYCAQKTHNISVVIAYKIDRIARNIDDYRQIRLLLKRYEVDIKSTTEYFEDTPAGRFMENIIANVAQFDNDVRTERSIAGMKDAIRDGRFVWCAPIGYNNLKAGSKSNIVPNKKAHLVQKAFEEVATDKYPTTEVLQRLTKEGLTNKSGKPLAKSYFYTMLRNELYTGWIIGLGEKCRGSFEPLITQELFDKVQKVLNKRKNATIQYQIENPDFPLRRFVTHPTGKKLTGAWSKGRNKKYAYYQFNSCNMNFKKERIEELFLEFIDQFEIDTKTFTRLRKAVCSNWKRVTKDMRNAVKQSNKHITELKEQKRLLIQKNLKGVISDTLLTEQLAYLDEEIVKGTITISPVPDIDVDKQFDIVAEYIKKPSTIWRLANIQTKLRLQWFNFPQGVIFDGNEFRTTKTAILYKLKDCFLTSKSSWVPPSIQALNQKSINPYVIYNRLDGKGKFQKLNTFTDLQKVVQELTELSDILGEKKVTKKANTPPLLTEDKDVV